MKNVLSKLAQARLHIRSHPLKKNATNDYSKYDYFSPELISSIVNAACIEADSICVFSLKKDELGYFGELIFTDLESGESLTTILRTEKPEIKATNQTQQMGGMNTYAKRYALMSLFDIEDNTMDFDASNNKPSDSKQQDNKSTDDEKPWLNKKTKEYDAVIARLQKGTTTIQQVQQYYKLNKEVRANLEACTKDLITEKPIN
ncbi:MAG: ERF family protein [Parafilimonas sp.]